MPDASQIEGRLDTVLTTIYLLFNEGYYSMNEDSTLRKELCLEAMRLCTMLIENKITNKPAVNALLALMCFHASRFETRLNKNGELVLYEDQDEHKWNPELISKGGFYLHAAASGNTISKFHLEAAIAYWNTQKQDTKEKWETVLHLYNQLLTLEYSPIAALNRTYVISKVLGKQAAIAEAEQLSLGGNPFYYSLLGELYTGIDNEKAGQNLQKALSLVKYGPGKQVILKKLANLGLF